MLITEVHEGSHNRFTDEQISRKFREYCCLTVTLLYRVVVTVECCSFSVGYTASTRCMCMCTYVSVHVVHFCTCVSTVCMCLYVYVGVCTCAYVSVCVCKCLKVYTYVLSLPVHSCPYVYVRVCMCIYMSEHVRTYIYLYIYVCSGPDHLSLYSALISPARKMCNVHPYVCTCSCYTTTLRTNKVPISQSSTSECPKGSTAGLKEEVSC